MDLGLGFVSIFHIVFAVILVTLVLLQDSKGGAMGVFGGGGASTVFGASGGTNFLVRATQLVCVFFAFTCIYLTYQTNNKGTSVVEGFVAPPAAEEKMDMLPTTDETKESDSKKDETEK
jgi:preprotein translocase subunit SecG